MSQVLAGETGSDIKAELHRERKRLLVLIHLLAIIIDSLSLIRVVYRGEPPGMVVLQSILLVLLILNLYLLIRLERLARSALLIMILASLASLIGIMMVVDQGIVVKEVYWTVVIVPAAFYLTGRRGGLLISGSVLLSVWGIFAYSRIQQQTKLDTDTMLDYSGIYLVITLISFLYAHAQSLNIRRMLHYSQNLAFANDELKVAALTDTLTCTYNRKFLDEFLHELTTRQLLTFSLIMMDIDHFKQVNDRHGHQVGDDILRAVTKGLQTQLRDKDILGRWGGEEFILIAQGLEADKAMHLAERLREFIEVFEFPHGLNITCSFGVVEWLNKENKTELVKRADTALYEAKKAGRNRCVLLQ